MSKFTGNEMEEIRVTKYEMQAVQHSYEKSRKPEGKSRNKTAYSQHFFKFYYNSSIFNFAPKIVAKFATF